MATRIGDLHGWRTLFLDSGEVELAIPLDVGPRVTSARVAGGPNLFAEVAEQRGGRGEGSWCIRGGHRLWHAPEDAVRTYALDNAPIAHEVLADGTVKLVQPAEPLTGIVKEIEVRFLDAGSVRVLHRLRNAGSQRLELAPWCLTVLAAGGYGVVPLPRKGNHPAHLLPEHHLVPWPYTDFGRPIWRFHREFIGIDTTRAFDPQKLGIGGAHPGWAGYWKDGTLFVKDFPVKVGASYPDMGSVFETFSCDWMLELETLAPLGVIAPGATAELVETWGFFRGVPHPGEGDAYARAVAPLVEGWRKGHGLGGPKLP